MTDQTSTAPKSKRPKQAPSTLAEPIAPSGPDTGPDFETLAEPTAPKVNDDAPADRLAAVTVEIADLEARRPALLDRLANPADARAAEQELARLEALHRHRARERADLERQLAELDEAARVRARQPHIAAARTIAHESLPQTLARLQRTGEEHAAALVEAIEHMYRFGVELGLAEHPSASLARQPSLAEVRAGAPSRIELALPTFGFVAGVAPGMLSGNRMLTSSAYGRLLAELQALVDEDAKGEPA